MNKCRKCKDSMIEALYGELGPAEKQAFDEHLGSCPECASEYSVLGATLRVMDARKRPDPGAAFWDGYWDRLSRKMKAEIRPDSLKESAPQTSVGAPLGTPVRTRFGRLLSGFPRWSWRLAGAAALVLAGILIGRGFLAPPSEPVTVTSVPKGAATAAPVPASDPATDRAHEYLERSKVLLLGLVNYEPGADAPYALDFPRRQELSRELVSQAADIRGSLSSPGQSRLRALVADLERILLQIANLETDQDLEAVEIVRYGVEQTGLFLKIDLTRMARGARSADPEASVRAHKPTV